MADLKINIAGLEFKNPVTTASGCFGYGEEFRDFTTRGWLGGSSSRQLQGRTVKATNIPAWPKPLQGC